MGVSMAAIETRDLSRSYGDVEALKGLTLTVEEGELFGFLGPNGAGKSTTIRVLTGQLDPDAGSARVMGVDPAKDPVGVRERLGVLPEREDPPSFLTPREYLAFVGEVRGIPEPVVEERTEAWAEELAFRDKLDVLSTSLSRGQRQKVMIAQAFLHDPPLVLIDEPLSNLDPVMQERVKRRLLQHREAGNTIFLSTHNVAVAQEICTRVGIIYDGTLLATEDPRDLPEGTRLIDRFLEHVEGRA